MKSFWWKQAANWPQPEKPSVPKQAALRRGSVVGLVLLGHIVLISAAIAVVVEKRDIPSLLEVVGYTVITIAVVYEVYLSTKAKEEPKEQNPKLSEKPASEAAELDDQKQQPTEAPQPDAKTQ